MTRTNLIDELRTVRQAWDLVLGGLESDALVQPGAVGDWSAKDVVAHVTWSERETAGMLRARALVGSELWRLPEEARNAAVYEENRDRPVQDILSESAVVHGELLAVLEGIPEAELLGAAWFRALPGDWPPYRVVEVNVTEHYRHHLADLRRWLRL
jgi:muconolactone delta-isomerase